MRGKLINEEWTTKRSALHDNLYEKVVKLSSLPSAEHEIGTVKKEYLNKMTGEN